MSDYNSDWFDNAWRVESIECVCTELYLLFVNYKFKFSLFSQLQYMSYFVGLNNKVSVALLKITISNVNDRYMYYALVNTANNYN